MLLKKGYCFAIYKESSLTSLDVVKKVKRLTASKKAGHGGALDPLAEGLLMVFTDQLVKLTNFCHLLTKEYIAKIRLGLKTETYDLEGQVVYVDKSFQINEVLVNQAIEKFKGDLVQKPPQASAVKIDGKPAYYYFRRSKNVEIPVRLVRLEDARVIDLKNNDITVYLKTSGGFYVRTFANDLGLSLGACGGCLVELKRISIGSVSLEKSLKLSSFSIDRGLDWHELFTHLPIIKLIPYEAKFNRQSQETKRTLIKKFLDLNCNIAVLEDETAPAGLIAKFRGSNNIVFWFAK